MVGDELGHGCCRRGDGDGILGDDRRWYVSGGRLDERPEALGDLGVEIECALGEVDELGALPRQVIIPGG